MDTSSSLVRRVSGKAAVVWNTTSYRKMCLISSWLGFICLLDYKVPYLKKFRNNNGDVVTILGDLHKGQVRTKVAEAKRIKVPSVRTQPCTTTLCNQKGTYDQ